MKEKGCVLILLILMPIIRIYSQADSILTKTFDVYLDVGISSSSQTYRFSDTTILRISDEQYGINNFTLGLSKTDSKGWYKSWSILFAMGGYSDNSRILESTGIPWSAPIDGERVTNFKLGGIFEQGRSIDRLSKNQFKTVFSFGASPFVEYFKIQPNTVGGSLSFFSIGFDALIIPNLEWQINNNLAINLRVPVEFGRVWYFWQQYSGTTSLNRFQSSGLDVLFDLKIPVVRLGASFFIN